MSILKRLRILDPVLRGNDVVVRSGDLADTKKPRFPFEERGLKIILETGFKPVS